MDGAGRRREEERRGLASETTVRCFVSLSLIKFMNAPTFPILSATAPFRFQDGKSKKKRVRRERRRR